jgi:hypothetical protein
MTDFGKTSVDMIRARLEAIIRKITRVGSGAKTGFWVGDVAAERQVADDLASGRVHWHEALLRANAGIASLDEGDADLALEYLLEAHSFAVDALGLRLSRVRDQEGLKVLAKPAQPRGRKKTAKPE